MVVELILIVVGLTLAVLVFYGLLYVRDMFRWRKVIQGKLDALVREKAVSVPAKAKAIDMVEGTCRYLLTNSVDVSELLAGLPGNLRKMAALFHPDAPKPELRVTPAHILLCVDRFMPQLDEIKVRPGFSSLAPLSVRELLELHARYKAWFQPNKGMPPLSGLFSLLKNARLLMYARYLLTDLYLFLGRLGMAVYGEDAPYLMEEKKMDLEVILTELSRAKSENGTQYGEKMAAIRSGLVGMSSVLVSEPGVAKWKKAVTQAAELVAKEHFPDSPEPLLEARIGPLMSRSRVFLTSLGKGEDLSVAGKILKIRLETLLQAKSISQTLIPPQVRQIMMRTQKTYGWLKWPLNIYMMASKGIFWKIAVDMGWFAGRKAILVLIFGRGFDKAVHELEALYSLSVKPSA